MQPAALRSVTVDQSFQQNEINGKTQRVLFWGRGMPGQLLRLYAAAAISPPGSSGRGVVPVEPFCLLCLLQPNANVHVNT
jgi:hypothetical protein